MADATPTPRWTAETEELAWQTLVATGSNSWRERLDASRAARQVLIALADAGVLIPVGGETRQEIEVQTAGLRYPCSDMPRAWRQFGELKAKNYDARIVQRDVWVGPWREVTDGD